MKKIEIIIILIVSFLVVIVLGSAIFLPGSKTEITQPPVPIQTFSPSPSPTKAPPISIPPELESEKIKQENYAKTKEEFILSKPWVLRLPLKSTNYFISYDPASDTVIAELYYLENNALTQEQQLSIARQTALNAMVLSGIDTNKQKVEYLELLKKQ